MKNIEGMRRAIIGSVGGRLAVAIVVGSVSYFVALLLATCVLMFWPGIAFRAGGVVFLLYTISPVVLSCTASALTYHLLSPRSLRRRTPFHYTVARFESPACLAAAALVFLVLLIVSPFVLEMAAKRIWDVNYLASVRPDETLNLIFLLGLSLCVPYVVSRAVYGWLRWRRVHSVEPLCPKCLYNLTGIVSGVCPACGEPVTCVCHQCQYDLTGNVSGLCPECGTPIGEKQPDKPDPKDEETRAAKFAIWIPFIVMVTIAILLVLRGIKVLVVDLSSY